ncbi:MAG: hypothetical protein ABIH23_20730, partial [bacterium]
MTRYLLGVLAAILAVCPCFAQEEWRTPSAEFSMGDLRNIYYGPGDDQCVSFGNNRAFLWDLNMGTVIKAFDGHTTRIAAVTTTPNGEQLLAVSDKGVIKSWDIQSGELLQTTSLPIDKVSAAVFSPDAERILTTDYSEQSARL